jgi:hypothetical protein
MAENDLQWRKDLHRELEKIVDHFTTARYEPTLETQRTYEQTLDELGMRYSDRNDYITEGRREQFDKDYQRQEAQSFDHDERQSWQRTRILNDQWATRAGQAGDRADLSDGTFRERDDYKALMQGIGEEHIQRQEKIDEALRAVAEGLNERFGFVQERPDREANERER